MYIYSIEAMPGHKAKFDGDTSVKYNVRRKYTSASADKKNLSDVIRTDLDYSAATALVAKFNDKERASRAIKHEEARAAH
jgi:hypothetical protein